MKYEWRKKDKDIYLPKKMEIKDIPTMQYLTVKGAGIPGDELFAECVGALYAVSYALKMNLKNKEGFYDYTVFPLEGIWDLNEEGRKLYSEGISIVELKHLMTYTLMVRQPEFITEELFTEYRDIAYSKKKNEKILELKLETIDEGEVCQFIHIGSYDSEPETFRQMEEYAKESGYERAEKTHKEIYISDPSKVAPEKLKTTLKFKVKRSL